VALEDGTLGIRPTRWIPSKSRAPDSSTDVYVVEVVAKSSRGRRLTDDEISELIEVLVDQLDRSVIDPSVGTVRHGDDVDVTVAVPMTDQEELDGHGPWAVRDQGRVSHRWAQHRWSGDACDLRSRIVPLQSA